jgi:hypothetical protein
VEAASFSAEAVPEAASSPESSVSILSSLLHDSESGWTASCSTDSSPTGESGKVSPAKWMRIGQGCQMVYFQTKNINLGKFWRDV